MSQHKYNDAYNKGFEDGKKKAFDDWVYQCYDELSPKEQIELLLSEGAELPRKVVLKALEEVKAEIEKSIEESAKEAPISECGERYGFWKSVEIIDRKIAEVKGNKNGQNS